METKQVRYVGGFQAVDLILPDDSYVTVARGEVVELDASVADEVTQQSIWEAVGPDAPDEPETPATEPEAPEAPEEPPVDDAPIGSSRRRRG